MRQHQPRQQPGLNDMQMLQRQIMLKQLQELRRHQQHQELGDGRQQNYLNQLSATNKQTGGGQFLPPINGTPIHDASQMFMAENKSLVHPGASPAVQRFPNGFYSQAQSRDLHSMGLMPQQLEGSLHGTPIASSRNNFNQYSHPQGSSHDYANALTKGSNNQTEKPLIQSSDFSNSVLSEKSNISSDQLCMPDGAFLSKQFNNGKNMFGQVPIQGISSGNLQENFQQVTTLQRNESVEEFNGRQNQADWPEKFPGTTTQNDPSQGSSTLDPLEQKILFNLDDNSWNPSFGSNAELDTGGFGNALECADYTSSFPSIQSGSWSALMQSAVAEASSSDTGLQEEWSGLSFQNPEPSNDNQTSNFMDSGKQQTGWVDNNVQSAFSLSRKLHSNMSTGFPGFQQSGVQFSIDQRVGILSDSSHESVQQSPKIAAKWLDYNSQQNESNEKSRPIQTIQPMDHAWPEHNASHHPIIPGEVRENAFVHASDSRHVARGNQKSSNQVLCQEVSQGSNSHQQGYSAQYEFVGDISNSAVGLEKGHLSDIRRNSKASKEVPPRGNIGANASASIDRSVGIYSSNLTSQTRENMLEFHHKVDHTREQKNATHLSSSDSSPLLEVPEAETPQSSMAISYDQSSGSQRFGLRLAPPSQQLDNSNSFFTLQNSPKLGNSTETSTTDPFYPRNQLQKLHPSALVAAQSPEATLRFPYFNRATSLCTSSPPVSFNPFGHHFPVLESVPVSQSSLTSGFSQQVVSSTNTNLQTPQWTKQESNNQNPDAGLFHGQESVTKHISEANPIGRSSLIAQHHQENFDSARQVPAVLARDIEAFGRSLKPSNLHPNYSLLHQVHSLNNVDTYPSRMVSEKNHGDGSGMNIQQATAVAGHQVIYGHNSGIKGPVDNGPSASSWPNSVPNRDIKMLRFSSELGDNQSVKASSLPLFHDYSQEVATHGRSYSQSDSAMAFNTTEHSQNNLQMPPSCFKHYVTLQNGQIFPMSDEMTAKNSAQQFCFGKPFENLHVNNTDTSQVSVVQPTTATTLAADKLSAPCVLPPDVIDWNLSAMRSKKRKIEMSELLPWHKEVTQSSKRLQTIRVSELEWAQAANRLIEKVEDETEMIENAQPLLRLRKRLMRTTQLMQQVFSPAPAVILSADATSNYDSVAYYAAKLALGDACNLSSCSKSDSCLSSNGHDMIFEVPKTSGRIDEQYFSKIVEDFITRVKKLESDLFRLDEEASIVDIRVQYQELEKFSTINRFAKFHCRGQPDAAETSSSTGATPTPVKLFPQRYVTAFPMPRAVPEGAQCLAL
ncbi:uncharacterized protein LOC130777023 [Actinidia eriantha]|uniref:uncharacterized protein LOC130777023 n=1 Tax=Actinidia eriantha TaxID=165200 RepID=UPI0025840E02|nr:uncharacterized protein LOC130777023 [Actinidia eriantha]XP_057491303.1 uncharacterized protein LOC130777023 [Actinidia eriantha]